MRVCIASPDIVGPIRNGGVGTACTALAQTLASAGHAVDLFYTSTYYEAGDAAGWRTHYGAMGIGFFGLEAEPRPPIHRTPSVHGEDAVAISYRVYQTLKVKSYDVIHFVDYGGLGYFTALAKHQGLCLKDTAIVVTAHAPTMWSRYANAAVVDDITYLIRDRMERKLVEYADVLVSPSRYMLSWMQDQRWILPIRQAVIPNILPGIAREAPSRPATHAASAIREIVFFGRLEPRKGLLLFCDMIDRIDGHLSPDVGVTFLGKEGQAYPLEALRARSSRWRRNVTFLTDHDTFEAVDDLRAPGRLVVMAAVLDNSPYTLMECLFYRIPFVATAVGGVPELVAAGDHARVLAAPTPAGLAEAVLAAVADTGFAPADAAFDFEEARTRHIALHDTLTVAVPPSSGRVHAAAAIRPLVTVNLLHFERIAPLMQALGSIEAQDYPEVEVVIVDNGSCSADAIDGLLAIESAPRRFPISIVRMKDNHYEAAARNAGAYRGRGRYILFMDDDNIAKSNEISTFCGVAERTSFDILTCFSDYFLTTEPPDHDVDALKRFVVMGDFGSLGLILNGYGDLNCFVRRDRFLEVGGFTIDGRFNHAEDWRFFVKAQARGLRIGVVPESLLWYRVDAGTYGGGWRKRDRGGALDRAALAHAMGDDLFARLAQGLFWRAVESEGARKAALAELDQVRAKSARQVELVAQLTATNRALRQDLLSVIDFVDRSVVPQLGDQGEIRRAADSLALFAARGP